MDLFDTTLRPQSVLIFKAILDVACVALAVGRVCATWRTKTRRAYIIHGLLFLAVFSQIASTIITIRSTTMELAIRKVFETGEWVDYLTMWAAEGRTGLENIGAWKSGIGVDIRDTL